MYGRLTFGSILVLLSREMVLLCKLFAGFAINSYNTWETQQTCFITFKAKYPEHSEVGPKKAIKSTKKEKHESARQVTIYGCFSAQQTYDTGLYKGCENALVEFMCKYLQPICAVESPSFLKVVSALDPRCIPASCTTFTRTIVPAKYTSVKEVVLASLATASHCSLTSGLHGCHKKACMHNL